MLLPTLTVKMEEVTTYLFTSNIEKAKEEPAQESSTHLIEGFKCKHGRGEELKGRPESSAPSTEGFKFKHRSNEE